MSEIADINQARMEKEQPSLGEIIKGMTAHNCDPSRPYLEQQPKRAQMEIKGLTRRDISDCMALGILSCRDAEKHGELPRIYVSEAGSKFKEWDDLVRSGEGFADSYLDPERVSYNDLYGWDIDDIDPIAAIQNMACYLERRLGIYPALID